ncbi:MAG: ABC transporter ATP-binding protein/permease [Chloroflexi bacterium]|nr:ABC transporter ATP-binding protein/permease [Chloroflexota bacterium]
MLKEKWGLIRRVFHYARPYRTRIYILLALILITTMLSLVQPLVFRDLIDITVEEDDLSRLNTMAVLLFVLPVVNGLISIYKTRLNAAVSEGVVFDLRHDLYSHLQDMSIRFYTNNRTGELLSRLNNDVRDAQRAISSTIINTVTLIVKFVALLIVMGLLEWRLLLFGLLLLPIYIPISKRASKYMDHTAREKAYRDAAMNTLMHETLNIGGAFLVKLFGQRRAEIARFDEHAGAVRDIHIEKARINEQFSVWSKLLGAFGIAGVYWIGGYLVLEGVFTIGTIIAFAAYLSQFYSVLQSISELPPSLATSLVSFERVFEVIDLPPDIQERPNAVTLKDVKGHVRFEDVRFTYTSEDVNLHDPNRKGQVTAVFSGAESNGIYRSQARVQALDGVSLDARPGQLIALVGPSGAGKTTMTYLIPRLYDPDSGAIYLDGHDLRDITLDSLAEHIGMVTQDTYLFHDTIEMNLRYAKPDATMEDIIAACKAAHIHDFISELPDGYQTIVGERGYRLSGGEKQRIAIARVILKAPQILVLDEATSHLDSQSEKLIQDAMERVIKGRTSFVIAHRLSTIQSADQILVMNRGEIVERGTHDELLAKNGLYAQLHHTQFSLEV